MADICKALDGALVTFIEALLRRHGSLPRSMRWSMWPRPGGGSTTS